MSNFLDDSNLLAYLRDDNGEGIFEEIDMGQMEEEEK